VVNGLKDHYRYFHNLKIERRISGHYTGHFLGQVAGMKRFSGILRGVGADLSPEWYAAVARGELPSWLPRQESDTPILDVSFLIDVSKLETNQDNNEDDKNEDENK
jgi:hypothetical protein